MVQLFRLRHSSLRLKIPLFSLLGLFAILFGIGISTGITSGAPLFSTPVTAAQGRFISDIDMHTRKDGLTFVVGTAFTVSPSNAHLRNYLSLTVLNNGSSYASSVNADALAIDLPVKYPSIAFSPIDGTGYVVWRTNHGQGSESDLRVIPNAFNGTNNVGLGAQVRLRDKIGYQLDQPAVGVKSDGNIVVTGYAFIQGAPVTLRLITFDKNTFDVVRTDILDTQAPGQVYEMDPAICVDPNNNITVASMFPYGTSTDSPSREYAYTGINAANFVKTDITPQGWIVLKGGKARDIVCAPDGTVYVAINNRGQYDLYKRTPGAGGSEKWAKTATNVFQIYADAVAVSVGSDGKVWASQADGQDNSGGANANNGANVKFSTDGGFTFSANERAIPQSNNPDYSRYVAIDANPYDNKVHLILSTQYDYDNFTTQYAFAVTTQNLPAPTNLTATAVSQTQVNLSWTAPAPGADTYRIYRATSPEGTFTQIGTSTSTTYQDTNGLTFGTNYYYKVNAIKTGYNNSSDSNIASATTFGPSALVFITSPNGGVANAPLTPSPTIKVVDQAGNTVTGFSGSVTFSIEPGTGAPGAVLGGTTTQNISGGVSSFSGSSLVIDRIAAGYQLRATVGTLTGISAPFNQTGTLAIGSLSGLTATVPFSVTVDVNKNGGKDTNYNGPVYLTFNTANGAYYFGQTAAIAVGGTATFINQMIDTPTGSAYSYSASLQSGLGSGSLNGLNVASYPSNPTTCTRYMFTTSTSGDANCSKTTLDAAITASTAPNPNLPVYVDHRATGFGTGQLSLSIAVALPDGVIIDGGCSGGSAQGLLLNINNNLTVTGNNHYLRGIFFQGSEIGNPLFKGGTGNVMSCDKVAIAAG